MAGALRPAIVLLKRLSPPKKRGGGGGGGGGIAHLQGIATLTAIGAMIGVPVLSASFPRWVGRLTIPLLAVTSVGVYLTVPDTEHVRVVLAVMFVAGVVGFAAEIKPHPLAVGAVAFVMMGEAIQDSAGREEAIVRAAGCFGVLLVAPVAGWLRELRENGGVEHRPTITVLVLVHGVVVGLSSRALIRQRSIVLVSAATGTLLLAGLAILFATARPVAAEP